MKIGYARVSTIAQNLDRQIDELKIEGCDRIMEEKESGGKKDRPVLTTMLDMLKEDDIVIVSELTRLSRSTKDPLWLYLIFRMSSSSNAQKVRRSSSEILRGIVVSASLSS